MTPRRYKLGKRTALKEQTRHRIVEATFELHGEQGVVATSMQDVADRADVALHTVYRYFPRIDDLVKGCAQRVDEHMAPPSPDVVVGITERDERVRVFVSEIFAMHERGADLIGMARCQQAEVPALAAALEAWAQHHELFAREALRPAKTTAQMRREILALTDYFAWKAFAEHGISTQRSAAIVAESVLMRLTSTSIPKRGGA